MAKLTELPPIEVIEAYGRAFASYIGPCPWNPFPRSSEWGRKIEEYYREDQTRRRAALEASRHDQ